MKKTDQKKILKQQEAEQAPPPSAPKTFIVEAIRDAEKATKERIEDASALVDKQNKVLMDLYGSEAWTILKARIEAKKKYVREALREKVRSADIKPEDIGFRYLIADQVEGAFDAVIAIVEDLVKMAQIPIEPPEEV